MTPALLAIYAEGLQSAIQAHDFSGAQSALHAYCTCFRSRGRNLKEVEEARNLLRSSVQLAQAQKAHLAEELMRLKRICEAYGSPTLSHTWRLEG